MNRILYIDFIKTFAILSVIFLHNSAPILIGEINLSCWMIGNVYDSMVRMAVPLFFMVSGVLLLNQKEEPLLIFFKKRFLKVVIPLLAWSFFYLILKKYGLNQNINIIKEMFISLNHPQFYHLWFLYTIIGIYLFLPILKIFIQHASQSIIIYFIFLWIISVSIAPLINYFTSLSINTYIPMLGGYIGYLVLGYQLSKIDITKNLFYISVFFIATIVTALGTYYLSESSNKFIDFFYGYLSISTLIQAIAYFIVIKYIVENLFYRYKTFSKIVTTISITSLGIYLIHPFYMIVLEKMGITVLKSNPLIIIPTVAILTFILSFVTIFFLQKTSIGKLICP